MQITTATPGDRSRVVAVLGPTNTGKTYLAMERMLGHESGMIGFPLRLLARENYDRAVKIKGPHAVALITGEEKIVPPAARYFLCTVESMPVGRPVAFLGIDEIQMCADADRGHIFTDRLLHARGGVETMLMGAETVWPLLRRLVPGIEFVTRPRFSNLTHGGQSKISRLPPRSAVVAFSAADVYAIAELIRRQRGGTAVVLGALSPRTRNAQVAMYQAGEVDYLVATDAIGMGLNMNVDHVAFAATRKFDGRVLRPLNATELAQIAGRAGRHMNDGTFGTTAEIGPLDAELVDRIENHRFEPLEALFWRNSEMAFTSIAALKRSLSRPPRQNGLIRAREADDEMALALLADETDLAALATTPDTVRLLWDVCQVPDFGKVAHDAHARLLARLYRYLMGVDAGTRGRLPTDWVARQVKRLDRVDGDIETLMQRIANIRTWTYVAYQGNWLDDAGHWQERTRGIEDKLSDALHERLIQRFVDRRTALLVGRLRQRSELLAAVNLDDEVLVEGHYVGTLKGFRFAADPAVVGSNVVGELSGAERAVTTAAHRALGAEIGRRIKRLETEADDAIKLTAEGRILWRGDVVARLARGNDVLHPRIDPLANDLLETKPRERIRVRLSRWIDTLIRSRLAALFPAHPLALSAPARGLLFQAAEALGSLPRARAAAQLAVLTAGDRKALGNLDLRIGRESIFSPSLLKPAAVALRGVLWAVHRGIPPPAAPEAGRTSVAVDTGVPAAFYEAVGYRVLGRRAVRVDIVERLAASAFKLSRQGAFTVQPELRALAGCSEAEMAEILGALGYQAVIEGTQVTFHSPGKGRSKAKQSQRHAARRAVKTSDSPFAELRKLHSRR